MQAKENLSARGELIAHTCAYATMILATYGLIDLMALGIDALKANI